jgi:hypothetical protein
MRGCGPETFSFEVLRLATTSRARARKGCKVSEREDWRESEGGRELFGVRTEKEEALSSRMA